MKCFFADEAGVVTRKLRIAIASAGRFHVLDLARELHALGHDVKFYSYVPKRRAMTFGLPAECHVALLPFVAPFVAWQLKLPRAAPDLREALTWWALNQAVMSRLQPCDVFIAMSGMYLEAPQYARRKFGAKIVIVRGSKHILAQDEILARTLGAERPSPLSIERELAGYSIADMIAVPARHVACSFKHDSSALAKLKVNTYGVDLHAFPLLPARPRTAKPVLVFAGTWCLQKGSDLLQQVIEADARYSLVHVGPLGDHSFPHGHPRFCHIPKVDQSVLSDIYRKADAFIQPSRQDGLSNVITQAVASGLPVLCTDVTGGEDLHHTPTLEARIDVVPAEVLGALQHGLDRLYQRLAYGPDFPPITESDRATLSWRAFALRYEANLSALLNEAGCASEATMAVSVTLAEL